MSPEVSGLVYRTPAYRTGSTAVYFNHIDEPFLGTVGEEYFTVLTVVSDDNGNSENSENGENGKDNGDENDDEKYDNNGNNNGNEYSIEVNVWYMVTCTNMEERGLVLSLL